MDNAIHWQLASPENLPPLKDNPEMWEAVSGASVECLVWADSWFPVLGMYHHKLGFWKLIGIHGDFSHAKQKIYFAILNSPFQP